MSTKDKINDILQQAKARGLPLDVGPKIWEAAATHVASKYTARPMSIRAAADKFEVTEVSVEKRVRDIISILKF